MANKALATRQKMRLTRRADRRQPRNPVAVAAKLRAAGPHAKGRGARNARGQARAQEGQAGAGRRVAQAACAACAAHLEHRPARSCVVGSAKGDAFAG